MQIVRLFLFFMFSVPLLSHASGKVEKTQLFNAKQAYLAGDYRQALDLYKQLHEKKPEDAGLAFHVGECYFALDLYTHAIEYLEKAQIFSLTILG